MPPSVEATQRQQRVMVDGNGQFFFGGLAAGSYTITAAKPGKSRRLWVAAVGTWPSLAMDADRREGRRVAAASEDFDVAAGHDQRHRYRRARRANRGRQRPRVLADESDRRLEIRCRRQSRDHRRPWRVSHDWPRSRSVSRRRRLDRRDVSARWARDRTPGDERSATSGRGDNGEPGKLNVGNAANQQFGDVVLLTQSGMPIPPAPAAGRRMEVYPTTFYPGAAVATAADALAVQAGDDRTGVNIQLKPVPTVRINGRLHMPDSSAGPKAVRLGPAASAGVISESRLETATALSAADGTFTLLGVPAGQYVLRVTTPVPAAGGNVAAPLASAPLFWAAESVSVADADISDSASRFVRASRSAAALSSVLTSPNKSRDTLSQSGPPTAGRITPPRSSMPRGCFALASFLAATSSWLIRRGPLWPSSTTDRTSPIPLWM